jgi:hypothetical protein
MFDSLKHVVTTHNLLTSSSNLQVLTTTFYVRSTEVNKFNPTFCLYAMSTATAPTASSITASFPTPIITPLASATTGQPTYATIRMAQTQLNGNAASIPSHSGDGVHGHLALTIAPAEYLLLTGVAFLPPVNPPAQPEHPAQATAAQISEINRLHTSAQATFRTYYETDKALRNQLILATPPAYVRSLYDDTLGFGNVTCLQLLLHLWHNYGRITQAELDANLLRMAAAWNPPTPIEVLFAQLEDGVRFATAGNDPPSMPTVVRQGYNIIYATGLFDVACREWRCLPDANKTMLTFQAHFHAADQDRRLTSTSASAGYHGTANAATIVPTPTTTSSSRRQPTAAATARPIRSYCWTHGHLQNPRHTSATCKNKRSGHLDTATASNRQGGSDETPTYTPRLQAATTAPPPSGA